MSSGASSSVVRELILCVIVVRQQVKCGPLVKRLYHVKFIQISSICESLDSFLAILPTQNTAVDKNVSWVFLIKKKQQLIFKNHQ